MRCLKFFIGSFLLVGLLGCPSKDAKTNPTLVNKSGQTEAADQGPLRVLVWDDPELADVIEREWEARSSSALEVRRGKSAEWLASGEKRLGADVVVFPSELLGQLAEQRMIRAIPTELIDDVAYDKLGIYDVVRRREMVWGGKTYAVSFGSPVLTLLSRDDLIAKENVPTTWSELSAIVKSLRSKDSSRPALLAPSSPGWPSKLLFVRTAPYIFDRARMSTVLDFRSLEPRIHTAPFVRALQDMATDHSGIQQVLTPHDVLDQFLDGRAAMAITWPSAVAEFGGEQPPTEFPITVSALPGSKLYFDYGDETWSDRDETVRVTLSGTSGRLGAISRTGRNATLASTFLGWATGPEFSEMIGSRSASTAPYRGGQQARPGRWSDPRIAPEAAVQYTAVLEGTLNQGNAWTSLRLPGRQRYFEALDVAIRDTFEGKSKAEDALRKASVEWRKISGELGFDEQSKAYRRSLNLE